MPLLTLRRRIPPPPVSLFVFSNLTHLSLPRSSPSRPAKSCFHGLADKAYFPFWASCLERALGQFTAFSAVIEGESVPAHLFFLKASAVDVGPLPADAFDTFACPGPGFCLAYLLSCFLLSPSPVELPIGFGSRCGTDWLFESGRTPGVYHQGESDFICTNGPDPTTN